MNSIQGNIISIQVSGHLSIVSIALNPQIELKAIVIETPNTAAYLREGTKIAMLFKETEVIIATGDVSTISLQNKIPGTIIHIERGTLLSKLLLEIPQGEITAIISTHAVAQLGLRDRSKVTAMIKLNEMMLSEL